MNNHIKIITDYLAKHGHTYQNDLDEDSVKIIYDLYQNGLCEELINCPVAVYRYVGIYYLINKNDDALLKYLINAADMGDTEAMYLLGYFYEKNKNYNKMLQYYQLAVDNGDTKAYSQVEQFVENEPDIVLELMVKLKKQNMDYKKKLSKLKKEMGISEEPNESIESGESKEFGESIETETI